MNDASLHLVTNGGGEDRHTVTGSRSGAVSNMSACGDKMTLGKREVVILTTDSHNVKHRRNQELMFTVRRSVVL